MNDPLIAVAHGSRDPRSAETMAAVVDLLGRADPGLDVRLAFLDLNEPSVTQVIDSVAAQGHRSAVVVPLLLGDAFHARVDLPGLITAAATRHPGLRLIQADVLGADPRLIRAARDRIVEAGIDPHDSTIGVAVAAVGSSSATANARTATVARRIAAGTAWRTAPCFVTTAPSVTDATTRLRTRGCRRIIVAPWFLAPGLLTDRIVASGHQLVAPIGAHPLLADVIGDRCRSAQVSSHRAA